MRIFVLPNISKDSNLSDTLEHQPIYDNFNVGHNEVELEWS